MRAKSFFYVCAGLFLLALGYHFGAGSARAEYANGYFFGATHSGSVRVAAVDGRVWSLGGAGGSWMQIASVPQTYGAIAAFDGWWVLTTTGYVWEYNSDGTWHGAGYAPVGATAARQESFGAVKARYR